VVNIAEKCLLVVTILVFACALFVSFYQPVETEDVWWHLSTGKWIIENHSVPHEDPFSFNDDITTGIFPQWLGSCIYYLIYQGGGFISLKLFRAVLFMLVLGIFFLYGRKQISLPLLLFLIFLASQSLHGRLLLRPFVFNFVFIQIFLISFLQYKKTSQKSLLILFLILGILWSNIHIGGFVYGLSISAIFIFSAFIQHFQTKNEAEKRRYYFQIRNMSLAFGIYLSGFLVNPYGLEGFLYPFKVFLIPNFINFGKLNHIIAELLPPVQILSLSGYWFYVLCFFSILSIYFMRREKFNFTLLFSFALFLFLKHGRAGVFFSLICLYIIVISARQNSFKDFWRRFKYAPLIHLLLCTVLISVSIVTISEKMNRKVFIDGKVKDYLSMDYDPANPRVIIRFLKDHNIRGPMFNSSGLGGFLIWDSYPDLKPFVDNRQFNQVLYAKYRAILREPDVYWSIAEGEFDFKIVLLDMRHLAVHKLLRYLMAREDYQLVYVRDVYLVLLKRGAFHLPKEMEDYQYQLESTPISEEDLKQLKEIASKQSAWTEKIFLPTTFYNNVIEEGVVFFGLGYEGAGIKRILQASKNSPDMVRKLAVPLLEIISHDQII